MQVHYDCELESGKMFEIQFHRIKMLIIEVSAFQF